jgi:two-component system, response regulator, stage 0 sporulation protein F
MMDLGPSWYESEDRESDANGAALRENADRTRIFVADDDEDMRILVSHALKKDGYEVVELKDGLEMMNRIQHAFEFPLQLPDLIVMDVLMPRYSGLGILAALRRARWFTPVILMTGLTDDAVFERSKELGAISVFRKPFDIDTLRTAVLNASLTSARTLSYA